MQTRDALRHMSGGQHDYQWGDGPLSKVADQLLEAFRVREADRMERADIGAQLMGTGPMFEALSRRFAEAEQRSLIDVSAPMVMRFDAYQLLLDASRATPTDRGLKMAAAHAKELWVKEPDGTLAVGDVARLRTHWANQFPKSRVAAVIDHELPKVGFNTLPVAKLAQLATSIRGRTLDELEQSYETVVVAHGLDGNQPHQIRARGFLRGLVHLASEPEPSGTVEAGGEAAADRTLWRMAAFDDPILRMVGQLEPASGPDMGNEPPIDMAAPMGEHEEEVPHEEGEGAVVEIESPITGQPLALELEIAEGEPGMEEPGMPPPMEEGQDVTPGDVEGLSHFGQLEDFMGGEPEESPLGMGEAPMLEGGTTDGEVVTTIEDPSAPGEMLEVTVRPVGQGEGDSDTEMPAVPLDVPMESEGGHIAQMQGYASHWASYNQEKAAGAYQDGMGRHGVAPEGWEHTVKEMKKEPGIDNPWALAWWMKDKGYQPHEGNMGMGYGASRELPTFTVWAIRGGVKASEPLERFTAESMSRALRHVAGSLGELGASGEVRGDPESFGRQALIVLDAEAGNHLLVLAEGPETGSEFYPTINEQQPAQVAIPESGLAALMGPGPYDQPRATREVDVSPGASAVPRGKDASMNKDQVTELCEKQLGLTAASVEASLLAAEPVALYTAEGKVAWKIEVDDDANVALTRGGNLVKKASLEEMDDAIADFLARCAGEYVMQGGGQVAGGPAVATHRAHFEMVPLFQVGCAQCGGISEYVMPEQAMSVRCASCGFETSPQAVHVQLQARQAAGIPGYLIVSEVPGERSEMELNARRLMTAIQKVVPNATGTLRAADGQLEVTVRHVGEGHIARIRNVLESMFGVHPQTRTAQGGPTQQDMQSTIPSQVSMGVNTAPQPGPTYKPPVQVPAPPIGGTSVQPQTAPMPGAPTGGPSQQQFMQENATIEPAKPVVARAGELLWNLTYRTPEGPRTLQVEAGSEQAARRIFAGFEPEAQVLQVRQALDAGPPAGAEPPAPDGAPPGAAPAAPPAAAPGAMMGAMPMQQGATITPEIQEAVRAAMITLRNTGVDPATAVDQFQSQFKQLLQKFGDEHSPGRQQLGAEIIKAVQEAWSKPALIDLTAAVSPRMAFIAVEAMLKDAIGKMPTPGKIAPEMNKDKVRVPKNVLGPDSASESMPVMDPGRIKTQHGKPQGGPLSSTDMKGGQESHDPGTFGAGKPPSDGSYGLVGKGTSVPNKDMGQDSQNKNNPTTSHWDSVSNMAPGMLRSKPGGQGAPDTRKKAALSLARLAIKDGEAPNDAVFWLYEAVKRAKALGDFPEDELWQAKDAGLEKVAFKGQVATIVNEALAAL